MSDSRSRYDDKKLHDEWSLFLALYYLLINAAHDFINDEPVAIDPQLIAWAPYCTIQGIKFSVLHTGISRRREFNGFRYMFFQ